MDKDQVWHCFGEPGPHKSLAHDGLYPGALRELANILGYHSYMSTMIPFLPIPPMFCHLQKAVEFKGGSQRLEEGNGALVEKD